MTFSRHAVYFLLFLGKGSLYPILAVFLRARGCSLFLMSVAMNVNAIARLSASFLLASSSSSSSSSIESRFRLLYYTICIGGSAAFLFSLCTTLPNLSALLVGSMIASLSVTSLVLDSLIVNDLSSSSSSVSASSSSSSSPTQAQQQEQEEADEKQVHATKHQEDVDVEAAGGFSELRLFGSLGWALGSFTEGIFLHFLQDKSGFIIVVIMLAALTSCLFFVRKVHFEFSHHHHHHHHGHSSSIHSSDDGDAAQGEQQEEEEEEEKADSEEMVSREKERREEEGKEEQGETEEEDDVENKQEEERSLSRLEIARHLLPVLVISVLFGSCDQVVGTFLSPFLKESPRNSSLELIEFVPVVNVLSELPVLYFARSIHRSFSLQTLTKKILIPAWLIRFASYLLLLNSEKSVKLVLIIELLNGICFALSFVSCIRFACQRCQIDVLLVDANEENEIPAKNKKKKKKERQTRVEVGAGEGISTTTTTTTTTTTRAKRKEREGKPIRRRIETLQAIPFVHGFFYGASAVLVGLVGGFLSQFFSISALFFFMCVLLGSAWILIDV